MAKDQVSVAQFHDEGDWKGIEAAETLERMNIRVRDGKRAVPMSGRVGLSTLLVCAAAQGVGMAAGVVSGSWWLFGAGLVGLGLTLWCGAKEEKLMRREGTSLGVSGALYTLLRGDAIKEEELDEMKRRGLEINL